MTAMPEEEIKKIWQEGVQLIVSKGGILMIYIIQAFYRTLEIVCLG